MKTSQKITLIILTVFGLAIQLDASSGKTLNIDVEGSEISTLSATVTTPFILNKYGTGTLVLDNPTTSLAGINIIAGRIQVASISCLGSGPINFNGPEGVTTTLSCTGTLTIPSLIPAKVSSSSCCGNLFKYFNKK